MCVFGPPVICCKACVWSCAYRDDERWHVCTQPAESATVTLTINCIFFLCMWCVVNGLWCAAEMLQDSLNIPATCEL